MTYGLEEYLGDLVGQGVDPNDQIYNYLSSTDTVRLKHWVSRLEKIRNIKVKGKKKTGQKSRLVGYVFEKVVRVLLDGCRAISHDGNVRSTISEIDFRILIEPVGATIPMLRAAGTHAIGEAKCVAKGLKIEWFTELSGILSTHSANLAIMFTASPPKKLRSDQRHALSLIKASNDQTIVPFGLHHIDRVANGENFLKILSHQCVACETHSSDLRI
ncbi:hypothetical protein [Alcanivorax sp.]|uniref:hypothetical protein n=1 Tax=Alcanivorax sp. TaxID=1872427 RepID=UPI003BAAC6B0